MRNPLRRGRPRDEGSMPMALLVTMVAMSLTASLVPVVVTQFTTTRTADSRTVALDAAQIGIDVALGQLRAAGTPGTATDGSPIMKGILESLPPCTFTGSQDSGGMLNAKDSLLYYGVEIAYYGVPDDATDPTPALLACPPVSVPSTAVITATGSGVATATLTKGSAGTRTLEATYTFKTTNENITGGVIRLAAPTSPQQLCMDGGADATPAAGTAVRMQWCKGGTSDQRFAYNEYLNLKLVGSETGVAPNGMCLDAPVPLKPNDPVTFQPCLGKNARQQWSLNNNGNFQGTSDGVNLDVYCLNLKTAGTPDVLVIGGCGGVTNKNVFRPEAKAGAGMASAATHQVVNYKQFSRCLDVTNHTPTFGYMIVWFCKQDPNKNVSWNQQWALPDISVDLKNANTERIRTYGPGNPGYCLRTPDSISGYVTMKPCPAKGAGPIPEKNMEWIVYGDTGNPVTSYRIVDTNGNCLTPTDLTVPSPDVHPSDGTAKVKVAPCTGDELQKWNAPPYFNAPLVLSNTKEK
ncbi:ricin-type beta-trefoil lectin domain protein [Actinoplanes sp. NPDC049316]|uniref:RICIN domain-containing protein n=1 Tax=Actinoplanes sp. NPDC049316 TaxID=3154727 RepID=UPI00344407C8